MNIHLILRKSDFQGAVEVTDVIGAFQIESSAVEIARVLQGHDAFGFDYSVMTLEVGKLIEG